MSADNVTMDLLGKALDASYLNHQVIANNVANVNTRGYRVLKMEFDNAFGNVRQLIDAGADQKHISQAIRQINLQDAVVQDEASTRVAIDQQMVELTKNSLRYQALINSRSLYSSIKSAAIKGGRG